jgi:RNAse (barnase) inhibitor barstar
VSRRDFALDLTRPLNSGVYFVGADDLPVLAAEAVRHELCVCHVGLAGCTDKDELLQRLARALQLPSSFGYNWDALADCLRDLSWLPAWGHVLLLDRADDLRHAAEKDFDILLGILDDAATFAIDRDQPLFAFLSLPNLFDEPAPAVPTEQLGH